MNQQDVTTKILAFLGSLALGFAAMINAVIAAVALFTGNLMGAAADAGTKLADEKLAASASSAATTAKAIAIAFAVLAAIEFGAGEFLRRRVRNIIVPIACGVTIVGEIGLSAWAGKFTALDAILIACAVFAAWTWWRLPRPAAQGGFVLEPAIDSNQV